MESGWRDDNSAKDGQATLVPPRLDERYLAILAAFRDRDLAALQRLVSPSVEVTIPGSGRFAGTYRGMGEVLALVAGLQRSVVPGSGRLLDVAIDDDVVNARVVVTLRDVRGRTLDAALVHRFEFGADGRAARATFVPQDQPAFDCFLPSLEV